MHQVVINRTLKQTLEQERAVRNQSPQWLTRHAPPPNSMSFCFGAGEVTAHSGERVVNHASTPGRRSLPSFPYVGSKDRVLGITGRQSPEGRPSPKQSIGSLAMRMGGSVVSDTSPEPRADSATFKSGNLRPSASAAVSPGDSTREITSPCRKVQEILHGDGSPRRALQEEVKVSNNSQSTSLHRLGPGQKAALQPDFLLLNSASCPRLHGIRECQAPEAEEAPDVVITSARLRISKDHTDHMDNQRATPRAAIRLENVPSEWHKEELPLGHHPGHVKIEQQIEDVSTDVSPWASSRACLEQQIEDNWAECSGFLQCDKAHVHQSEKALELGHESERETHVLKQEIVNSKSLGKQAGDLLTREMEESEKRKALAEKQAAVQIARTAMQDQRNDVGKDKRIIELECRRRHQRIISGAQEAVVKGHLKTIEEQQDRITELEDRGRKFAMAKNRDARAMKEQEDRIAELERDVETAKNRHAQTVKEQQLRTTEMKQELRIACERENVIGKERQDREAELRMELTMTRQKDLATIQEQLRRTEELERELGFAHVRISEVEVAMASWKASAAEQDDNHNAEKAELTRQIARLEERGKDAANKNALTVDQVVQKEAIHAAAIQERDELIQVLEQQLQASDEHSNARKEAQAAWIAASEDAQRLADERIKALERDLQEVQKELGTQKSLTKGLKGSRSSHQLMLSA